jgi:hypothetical protein
LEYFVLFVHHILSASTARIIDISLSQTKYGEQTGQNIPKITKLRLQTRYSRALFDWDIKTKSTLHVIPVFTQRSQRPQKSSHLKKRARGWD